MDNSASEIFTRAKCASEVTSQPTPAESVTDQISYKQGIFSFYKVFSQNAVFIPFFQ